MKPKTSTLDIQVISSKRQLKIPICNLVNPRIHETRQFALKTVVSSGYFFNVIFFNFSLVGPQLFFSSNRLIAEEKQNVTIACTASGQPQPSITWWKAFGSLSKDKGVVDSGALTIYNVAKNDGGIYMCKAENLLGRDTSTVLVVVFSSLRFKVHRHC